MLLSSLVRSHASSKLSHHIVHQCRSHITTSRSLLSFFSTSTVAAASPSHTSNSISSSPSSTTPYYGALPPPPIPPPPPKGGGGPGRTSIRAQNKLEMRKQQLKQQQTFILTNKPSSQLAQLIQLETQAQRLSPLQIIEQEKEIKILSSLLSFVSAMNPRVRYHSAKLLAVFPFAQFFPLSSIRDLGMDVWEEEGAEEEEAKEKERENRSTIVSNQNLSNHEKQHQLLINTPIRTPIATSKSHSTSIANVSTIKLWSIFREIPISVLSHSLSSLYDLHVQKGYNLENCIILHEACLPLFHIHTTSTTATTTTTTAATVKASSNENAPIGEPEDDYHVSSNALFNAYLRLSFLYKMSNKLSQSQEVFTRIKEHSQLWQSSEYEILLDNINNILKIKQGRALALVACPQRTETWKIKAIAAHKAQQQQQQQQNASSQADKEEVIISDI